MIKYRIFLFILYLQGCTSLSNFDEYTFETDSSISDAAFTDSFTSVDSGISDVSIDTISDSGFYVVDFLINGKITAREVAICLSCNSNLDCVSGEICDITKHICTVYCFDPICVFNTNQNNFSCDEGYCYPDIGCNNWIEEKY